MDLDAPHRLLPLTGSVEKCLPIENKYRMATVSLTEALLIPRNALRVRSEFGRTSMFTMSRRDVLASAAVAAAFGLNDKRLAFINPAQAETPLEPANGVYRYKVGSIE